jgi:peptidoglycan hydrolase CwlO-like protein
MNELSIREINSISYSLSRIYDENLSEIKSLSEEDEELKNDLETMNNQILSSYQKLNNQSLI